VGHTNKVKLRQTQMVLGNGIGDLQWETIKTAD